MLEEKIHPLILFDLLDLGRGLGRGEIDIHAVRRKTAHGAQHRRLVLPNRGEGGPAGL